MSKVDPLDRLIERVGELEKRIAALERGGLRVTGGVYPGGVVKLESMTREQLRAEYRCQCKEDDARKCAIRSHAPLIVCDCRCHSGYRQTTGEGT